MKLQKHSNRILISTRGDTWFKKKICSVSHKRDSTLKQVKDKKVNLPENLHLQATKEGPVSCVR